MKSTIQAWLRSSLQSTMLLGLVMIVLLWSSTWFYLDAEKETLRKNAFQDSANLARSFEQHISSMVHGEDGTLIVLRALYQKNPVNFETVDWERNAGMISNIALQYSVINQDGILIASSLGKTNAIDLSDREHFRVHVDARSDELFISKPLIGRNSARPSIQLSRRINNPDGSFGGVIVASVDPERLTRFYETIDIGRSGIVSLVGADGFVRASRGFKRPVTSFPPNSGVTKRAKHEPAGSFMSEGPNADGIRRAISYRRVSALPLTVTVGIAEDDFLAQYYADRQKYAAVAGIITAMVLIIMGLSVGHRRKLEMAYDALRKNEIIARVHRIQLRTTLEHIDQGIIMADPGGIIQVINRRTIELLELPEEWLTPGRSLKDCLRYLRDRGEFERNDFSQQVQDMLGGNGLDTFVDVYERTRPNGVILEVRSLKTPEGGVVRTFTDITARKQAEAKIAALARQDDLTGLANRVLFRERVERALKRAQRQKESLALLMLDLDRFKPINDTLGHKIGDGVLQQVARRLQECVRETDTVARIGGDEFAILQSSAATDEDVTRLARRVIDAIEKPFEVEGHTIQLGISIGISFGPRDASDYDRLLAKADNALYDAKKAGRGRYSIAAADLPRPLDSSGRPLVA